MKAATKYWAQSLVGIDTQRARNAGVGQRPSAQSRNDDENEPENPIHGRGYTSSATEGHMSQQSDQPNRVSEAMFPQHANPAVLMLATSITDGKKDVPELCDAGLPQPSL